MKIEHSGSDESDLGARKARLEELLAQPSPSETRPCSGCDLLCACSASSTCTCGCSDACDQAPRRLSSDPDQHPVEAKIIPLVYSLSTLRVCQPCWSCEGHYDAGGQLNRVPSVWFYADSAAYPAVIADYLTELRIRKTLSYPWQVSLVSWGNSFDITYAIEPDLKREREPRLHAMQKDVVTISERLRDEIRRLAGETVADIDQTVGARSRPPVPARPAVTRSTARPLVSAFVRPAAALR